MVVVVILGVVGFYGFGATVHYQTSWAGPVLTYGLANMALAFASTCVFGYVLVGTNPYRSSDSSNLELAGLLSQAGRGSLRRNQHKKFTHIRTGKSFNSI